MKIWRYLTDTGQTDDFIAICLKPRYAATRSAPPGGTRSKGSRILTVVPGPSDSDGMIVPPS